jgi:carbon-monoxide dehydrogenase medium subunit
MLPARFDYAAPTSLEEALGLLAERGDEAKALAGGQSLVPLMKLRLARPALIVDLNEVPGLGHIDDGPAYLAVGALARTSALADSPLVAERSPVMAAAAPLISDPIVRNRGTIGGSLAHADPAGDWGSAMIAADAEVVARRVGGERTIPVRELFTGTFTTSLEPDELITELRVPRPPGRSGGT